MPEKTDANASHVMSVFYLMGLAWRQKVAVLFCVLIALLLAIVYLHVAKPVYTVAFKITPAISSTSRASSGRFGAIASLAGVNIPQDDNSMAFEVYLVELQGRATAAGILRNPELMHRMFPKEWDAATGQWHQPPTGLFHPLGQAVKFLLGIRQPDWTPPDAARVEKILDDNIHISKTPYTPVVTISIESPDPETDSMLLWTLHLSVDDFIRQRTLTRTGRYIDYLNKQLAATTVNDYREALITSLVEQQKARMTASSGLPFAAEPVEPPTISSTPSSPNGPVTIVMSLLLGLAAGGGLAFQLDRWGKTFRASLLTDIFRRRSKRTEASRLHPARDPAE